ncbi:hypothetical protein L915_07417 [Phytophthora nicotianae]|uniref:DAGKc domain-containing protein n=1 Tax=Phytophthora nicotianae TaxID=4792 RepID=W2GZA8_PHYNI|nr:hypothetical protein L915_07417 [Phytophthora nicotianae]
MSLAQLFEDLHLESCQPPDERFAWLHRRSQHTQHPLVQFELSKTHCTLRIVAKQRRRKELVPGRRCKSLNHERTLSAVTTGSIADECEKPEDPISMELKWEDVLGAHLQTACGRPLSRRSVVPRRVYMLALYACPPEGLLLEKQKHKDNQPTKRSPRQWTFRFYGDEIDQVAQLHHALNRWADPRKSISEDISDLILLKPDETSAGSLRKFRVLIDSKEGSGRSKYEQIVAPMFQVANIETTVDVVEDNIVRDIAKQLPLGQFECITIVGGDSFAHEFIQGLMARTDWRQAIRQPFGILPIDCGSNNGLSASIAHHSHGCLNLENAAFALIKGRPQDLDITSVCNGNETRYSFLKLEWTPSNSNQATIPMHKTGILRDLRHSMSLRRQVTRKSPYSGRIWYLSQDADDHQPTRYFQEHSDDEEEAEPALDLFTTELGFDKWVELTGPFRSAWVTNTSHATPTAFVAPGAQLDDGYTYLTFIDGTQPRSEVWRMLFSVESGRHLKRPAVQQIGTRALKLEPACTSDRLCVDGHTMEGPSLVAQVHRGLARIVALPRQRQR